MTDQSRTRWTRRTALKSLAAGSSLAIAGCAGLGGDDDEPTDDDPELEDDADDDPDPGPEDDADDDPEPEPEDDLQRLVDTFDDQPFNDAQFEVETDDRAYTPRHVWWQANDDVSLFLHFDEPNPEEANELDYFGISVSGQFTADDIPAGQAEDFTHFHLADADPWEAGHGGSDVDDEGSWFVHHSVREVQYPFHDEPIGVGVDREFMPTPAPDA